jgi:hypothetical protein
MRFLKIALSCSVGFGFSWNAFADSSCSEINALANLAIDGTNYGNGGDAIVRRSPDGMIQEAYLLDYYESSLPPRKFDPNLGPKLLPVNDKVEMVIQRWEKLDVGRAARFRQWLTEFNDQACFLSGIKLADIPDAKELALPAGEGWAIEQLATQREPQFPEDRRYTINMDIWSALDNDSKAGLILHELIYRDAIKDGAENSIGVRYLNAVFSADRAGDWTLEQYIDRLRKSSILSAHVQGGWIDLRQPIEFSWRTGVVREASVIPDSDFQTPFGLASLVCKISFFDDGTLKGFQLAEGSLNPDFKVDGQEVDIYSNVSFYPIDCAKQAEQDFYYLVEEKWSLQLHSMKSVKIESESYAIEASGYMRVQHGKLVKGETSYNSRSWVRIENENCSIEGPFEFWDYESRQRLMNAKLGVCNIEWNGEDLNIVGATEFCEHQGCKGIKATHLAGNQSLKITSDPSSGAGKYDRVVLADQSFVQFYPDGDLLLGTLFEDAWLFASDGNLRRFPAGAVLIFDERDRVKEWRRGPVQ